MAEKIIAQQEPLKTVGEFIRRSRTGITAQNRPIGSFLFLGPSGVGKTYTAKILAETFFSSSDSLVKIDMSEFTESFNISKLIGAPAGYVGYKEPAKLTDAVKHRPYSVILLDEIEKAHRQVYHLLLQILEEGILTDATGRAVNFKNTIIIMTSNIGAAAYQENKAIGFGDQSLAGRGHEARLNVEKSLKEKFPPEFLSRVDQLVFFKPLDAAALAVIASLQLADLSNRLKEAGSRLTIDKKVCVRLAQISAGQPGGARAVRANIQQLIEAPLSRLILTQNSKQIKISLDSEKNIILR